MLTYREPQNPEYCEFVKSLKNNAKKMFNFTIKDSLVTNTSLVLFLDPGEFKTFSSETTVDVFTAYYWILFQLY